MPKLSRLVLGIAATAITLVVANATLALASSANLVANPDFALPLPGPLTACILGPPVLVGQWQPYSSTPGYAPTTVPGSPRRNERSLHIQGPALGSCANVAAYQDLPTDAIPANSNLTISAWVYPVEGTQSQQIVYPWIERDDGGPVFLMGESVTRGTVEARAWGTSVTFSKELAGAWHHIVLTVNGKKHTATLSVDGEKLGTTSPGSTYAAAEDATVWIGQEYYSSPASDFYYADISVKR
jgi:hypothetical protein